MNNKIVSIGQASKLLGVTIQTIRNWDKQGLLKPDDITKGGQRRYKLETLKNINKNIKFNTDNLKTIAYARVSSHDQKASSTGFSCNRRCSFFSSEERPSSLDSISKSLFMYWIPCAERVSSEFFKSFGSASTNFRLRWVQQ